MNEAKSKNDMAWELLFDKYNIIDNINKYGSFSISSAQIKEFREPRLMTKFDHSINLPRIFFDNNLAILPITRGDYVISHFEVYHEFEEDTQDLKHFTLPPHIQSMNCNNIPSEVVALNYAFASGIIADFTGDEEMYSTVSGRMSSGMFDFEINDNSSGAVHKIAVANSQIEIDAAYEGIKQLSIFEAKRDLSNDFLIRQLYYPYRLWRDRISKTVKPIFLIYTNGIYRLYEYAFQDPNNYNSLILVKQQKYTIEDTDISISDIQDILNNIVIIDEPHIPFPQADTFERVINLCELLNEHELSRTEVTENYAFDVRQTNYYTDAARYLNLLEKDKSKSDPIYRLTKVGKRLFASSYKQRQLTLCSAILSHKAFNHTLKSYFLKGVMPSNNDIIDIMKQSQLYNVKSQETFRRRAQTIKSWVDWIVGLINS